MRRPTKGSGSSTETRARSRFEKKTVCGGDNEVSSGGQPTRLGGVSYLGEDDVDVVGREASCTRPSKLLRAFEEVRRQQDV